MRLFIMGGAGVVGEWVTRVLAAMEEVDDLIVADIDAEAAAALAADLGSKATPMTIDLTDRETAIEEIRGSDLLMNCTSFTHFDHVFGLAVAAGVAYADLISEPTDSQRAAAHDAQITAISGLGISPGLTNVLVRHASKELSLEAVNISGVSWRPIAASEGMLDTILWELSADCPTRQYFQDGVFHWAPAMEGSKIVDFGPPVGPQTVYYVPHTETTSLPRNFPELKYCAMRATWREDLMRDVAVLNKYGLLDSTPLPAAPEVSAFDATRSQMWQRAGRRADAEPWILFTNVEVQGRRDGDLVRREYRIRHPLDWGSECVGRQTGTGAAVGAVLLARGSQTTRGFVDPEVYFDPHEFLQVLGHLHTTTVNWTDESIEPEARQRAG